VSEQDGEWQGLTRVFQHRMSDQPFCISLDVSDHFHPRPAAPSHAPAWPQEQEEYVPVWTQKHGDGGVRETGER
jgi:hypothetical protein